MEIICRNQVLLRKTTFYNGQSVLTIESQEISQCLRINSLINVTTDGLLINYSHQGYGRHLVPAHNNSHHSGQLCWLKVSSQSGDTELIVDWLNQTCTPHNYISVHTFYLPFYTKFQKWRTIRWTGCEYKEDPISAQYLAKVQTIYVGLHVYYTDTPYQMFLAVRAEAPRARLLPEGRGKDLDIKHVTPFSGNISRPILMDPPMHFSDRRSL